MPFTPSAGPARDARLCIRPHVYVASRIMPGPFRDSREYMQSHGYATTRCCDEGVRNGTCPQDAQMHLSNRRILARTAIAPWQTTNCRSSPAAALLLLPAVVAGVTVLLSPLVIGCTGCQRSHHERTTRRTLLGLALELVPVFARLIVERAARVRIVIITDCASMSAPRLPIEKHPSSCL